MKKYLISYVKHGNCADYRKTEIVEAVSSKMALKKFYNEKSFGDNRTRKDWMKYETEMNGIWYSDITVVECYV